jgi:hypothetical protein
MGKQPQVVKSEDVSRYQGFWICDNGTIIERSTGKIMPIYENGGIRLLCEDGLVRNTQAHRLIAAAHVDNPDGYKYVGFKDGDSTNRNADNLFWIKTYKQISQTTQDILSLYRSGWSTVELARKFVKTPQYINRLLKDFRKNDSSL